MCSIPNTTRPDSDSETSREDGDIAASFTGKIYYQNIIDKANSVSLVKIFKYYGVRLDDNNTRTICPFSSHKGGRERTPSFNYYPHTNTYHCFGCNKGHSCCDFVSNKDKISVIKAAYKILELFGSDIVDSSDLLPKESFVERLEIMMDFSNTVRDFRREHTDQKSFEFIENICAIYDKLNIKFDPKNEALKSIVLQLKKQIIAYL